MNPVETVKQKRLRSAMNERLKGLALVGAVAFGVVVVFGSDFFNADQQRVKVSVSSQLRDPSSAQFRNLQVAETIACGEVNGKNGFGAYSGFREFVYRDGIVVFEPEEPIGGSLQQKTEFYREEARFSRLKRECIS